jgi:hypothetical protein
MHIGGIATSYPFRATAPASAGSVEATEERSPLQRTLDTLKSVAQTDADDRKARAKEKLEAAKKELEFLRRWSFDPEIVARQAGRLAREVGAAAKDFASAISAGSATGIPADTAAASAGQMASASAETAETDNADNDASFAQKAYQDTMEDGTERQGISADDRKTLQDFKAVAQEIKTLLEQALRRMRQEQDADKDAVQDAQQSGDSLKAAIQGLEAAFGSTGIAATVPVSITV